MTKIAIIHDWLDKRGGAENVLEELTKLYPKADIFSLVDFADREDFPFLMNKKIKTTFIQNIPFSKKHFRKLLPLFPFAIEMLNVKNYDLIISDSHAIAKGVKTKKGQPHLCYIHSPIRYAWELREQYLNDANIPGGLKRKIINFFLDRIKIWDLKTNANVTNFYANSDFIKNRVQRCYDIDSKVIYPPVDINYFSTNIPNKKQDFYFTISRHVGYKKLDIIISAFNDLPEKKLIIAGTGPDTGKLKKIANKNIIFIGKISKEETRKFMQDSKAFIHAALEDFGIVMVESLASGTPIIAYGIGGANHIVDKKTGVLYKEQNKKNLIDAIRLYEKNEKQYTQVNCLNRSQIFSQERFKKNIKLAVKECLTKNK